MILARAMLGLLPKVVTPIPPARQTQAEASETPNASMVTTMASVARPVLIIPNLLSRCRALGTHQSTGRVGSRSRILLDDTAVLSDHRGSSVPKWATDCRFQKMQY